MAAAMVIVLAFTCWLLWPEWNEYWAIRQLVHSLKSRPDDSANIEPMEALVRIGSPAVPALTGALRAEDSDTRRWAAFALGNIGSQAKEALPALVSAADDESPRVRVMVARALCKIEADQSLGISKLAEALEEEDEFTRYSAAAELRGLGPDAKAAVPSLVKLFVEGNAIDKQHAAFALGAIGAEAKDAFPVLLDVWRDQDEDENVRQQVAEALKKIDPAVAIEAGVK